MTCAENDVYFGSWYVRKIDIYFLRELSFTDWDKIAWQALNKSSLDYVIRYLHATTLQFFEDGMSWKRRCWNMAETCWVCSQIEDGWRVIYRWWCRPHITFDGGYKDRGDNHSDVNICTPREMRGWRSLEGWQTNERCFCPRKLVESLSN